MEYVVVSLAAFSGGYFHTEIVEYARKKFNRFWYWLNTCYED